MVTSQKSEQKKSGAPEPTSPEHSYHYLYVYLLLCVTGQKFLFCPLTFLRGNFFLFSFADKMNNNINYIIPCHIIMGRESNQRTIDPRNSMNTQILHHHLIYQCQMDFYQIFNALPLIAALFS